MSIEAIEREYYSGDFVKVPVTHDTYYSGCDYALCGCKEKHDYGIYKIKSNYADKILLNVNSYSWYVYKRSVIQTLGRCVNLDM